MGKTVTTEFAYFEPGPTRNPHDLLHTPGGSSSGSAAAVAAGLCTLALGTQTIGSVIRPAAFCGIIGFKPSYDRIPSAGLVYFSRTVDHVGLFTQDIDGMILASSVLCDGWQEIEQPKRLPVLGVPDGPFMEQTELEALGAFEHQIGGIAGAGRRDPAHADARRYYRTESTSPALGIRRICPGTCRNLPKARRPLPSENAGDHRARPDGQPG